MNTDLQLYRARVGLFAGVHMKIKGLDRFTKFELITWLSLILLRAGDVHENPGPDSIS